MVDAISPTYVIPPYTFDEVTQLRPEAVRHQITLAIDRSCVLPGLQGLRGQRTLSAYLDKAFPPPKRMNGSGSAPGLLTSAQYVQQRQFSIRGLTRRILEAALLCLADRAVDDVISHRLLQLTLSKYHGVDRVCNYVDALLEPRGIMTIHGIYHLVDVVPRAAAMLKTLVDNRLLILPKVPDLTPEETFKLALIFTVNMAVVHDHGMGKMGPEDRKIHREVGFAAVMTKEHHDLLGRSSIMKVAARFLERMESAGNFTFSQDKIEILREIIAAICLYHGWNEKNFPALVRPEDFIRRCLDVLQEEGIHRRTTSPTCSGLFAWSKESSVLFRIFEIAVTAATLADTLRNRGVRLRTGSPAQVRLNPRTGKPVQYLAVDDANMNRVVMASHWDVTQLFHGIGDSILWSVDSVEGYFADKYFDMCLLDIDAGRFVKTEGLPKYDKYVENVAKYLAEEILTDVVKRLRPPNGGTNNGNDLKTIPIRLRHPRATKDQPFLKGVTAYLVNLGYNVTFDGDAAIPDPPKAKHHKEWWEQNIKFTGNVGSLSYNLVAAGCPHETAAEVSSKLIRNGKCVTLQKDTPVLQMGEASDYVFVVLDGQISGKDDMENWTQGPGGRTDIDIDSPAGSHATYKVASEEARLIMLPVDFYREEIAPKLLPDRRALVALLRNRQVRKAA